MSLLSVDRLCIGPVDSAAAPIVDGLSFTLSRGDSLAIVGESGSGKTQAVLSLLGLQGAGLRVSGSARFDGIELIGARDSMLDVVRGTRIGMVFQDPASSLNPYLTVGMQIGESLEVHRGLSRAESHRVALRLLDAVRVADAARRLLQYPHELSGGMRQRVMLAAALACRPELLIADEPTTALDATVQRQLITLLRELQRDFALSLLLITHDLGVVGELCTRTLVMYAGRVMEEGDSERLLRAPTHPYTQALLRARPRLDTDPDAPMFAIAGSLTRAEISPLACCFAPRCEHAVDLCYRLRPPPESVADGVRHCHRRPEDIATAPG
ncbi:ABC transporter ATP-binding protein [Solimonas terrae]|uniref:ABC transporter ATP-binding protein n=1 Tax=Solimonas terrae TaxID=1396819 RepID=A0A6M2BYL1_9GAMM|nr:ABC transporter ATP-binding protein [Solimonas terrae]NGY06929.1 ABC transporter ATP-binding protein [Solimonas terrae]